MAEQTTITPAFFRPEQAAQYLSISKRHLCDLAAAGIIPSARIGKRLTLYARADLDAAIQSYMKARRN